jgi:hypothetical protein
VSLQLCGHLSDRIRNGFRKKSTDLVIIPSGITSQLQPLDKELNKLFSHLVCRQYDTLLNKNNHILTLSGKMKSASASLIRECLSKVWKEMPFIIIPKSF